MVEPLAEMLAGGQPNSLGRTSEVVGVVLADRWRLEELLEALADRDTIVRMRAGDALVTIDVLPEWAAQDAKLTRWLIPEFERLRGDSLKSVAKRAARRLSELG